MINPSNIPASLLNQIQRHFEADPTVIELRIRQRTQQAQGQFSAALRTAETIDHIFHRVVAEYVKKAEQDVEKVDLSTVPMSDDDRREMQTLGIAIFMACDLIETAVLDANDIIHRYDKDLHYDMFNDIRQLKKMVRAKLDFLKKNSGYMEQNSWGDTCDKMYTMLRNKARSLVNKRQKQLASPSH